MHSTSFVFAVTVVALGGLIASGCAQAPQSPALSTWEIELTRNGAPLGRQLVFDASAAIDDTQEELEQLERTIAEALPSADPVQAGSDTAVSLRIIVDGVPALEITAHGDETLIQAMRDALGVFLYDADFGDTVSPPAQPTSEALSGDVDTTERQPRLCPAKCPNCNFVGCRCTDYQGTQDCRCVCN